MTFQLTITKDRKNVTATYKLINHYLSKLPTIFFKRTKLRLWITVRPARIQKQNVAKTISASRKQQELLFIGRWIFQMVLQTQRVQRLAD